MSYEDLLKKWEPILEHPEFAEIKDPYKKKVTAILLENQDRDMEEAKAGGYGSLTEAQSTVGSDGFQGGAATPRAGFDPVLISMIRRSMPNLIAFDLMGVQPMSGPSGLIFAMRSKYTSQGGAEALHDEANTKFSGANTVNDPGNDADGGSSVFGNAYGAGGGMGTDVAEKLGDGTGEDFSEMALSIEKVSVVAKSRALKAEYTME